MGINGTDSCNRLKYPKIWLEFTAADSKYSTNFVKYRIQDIPDDRIEDAIQFLKVYYLPESTLAKALNATENKEFVEEFLNARRKKVYDKVSTICLRVDTNEIVGVNVCSVIQSDDLTEVKQIQNVEYRKLIEVWRSCYRNINIFEKYDVDRYLESKALSVSPASRGLGIGYKLIDAMKLFCMEFNIPLIHMFLTSDSSAYLTSKLGFRIDAEYTRNELMEKCPFLNSKKFTAKRICLKSWLNSINRDFIENTYF